MNPKSRTQRGFTLIELLIVVAIIAILAAIAVPNFLEAQTRSKVSRAKADIRSTVTALEAYRVDNNGYPQPIGFSGPAPFQVVDPALDAFEGFVPYRLTSPIAYITTLPFDVFEVKQEIEHPRKVQWHYSEERNNTNPPINAPYFIGDLATMVGYGGANTYCYMLFSHGPDLIHQDGSSEGGPPCQYDPSNGTRSAGDVYYFGPGGGFK